LIISIVLISLNQFNKLSITGFAVSSNEWEHSIKVTASPNDQIITQHIVFDQYKPVNCKDGILVTTSTGEVINYEIINSTYDNNNCLEATIQFNNVIYEPTNITLPEENITNQTIENTTNITEPINQTNITVVNITNETSINQTINNITINESNQTIENTTNITEIINQTNITIENITNESNITESNISVNNESNVIELNQTNTTEINNTNETNTTEIANENNITETTNTTENQTTEESYNTTEETNQSEEQNITEINNETEQENNTQEQPIESVSEQTTENNSQQNTEETSTEQPQETVPEESSSQIIETPSETQPYETSELITESSSQETTPGSEAVTSSESISDSENLESTNSETSSSVSESSTSESNTGEVTSTPSKSESITPSESLSSGGSITAAVVGLINNMLNKDVTYYIYYGRITQEINKTEEVIIPGTNSTYEKIEDDPDFDVLIDNTSYINKTLTVLFHHNSNVTEPIIIIGNVSYDLNQTESKTNETVRLEVYNWTGEYFKLKVGAHSEIIRFGKEPDVLTISLDTNKDEYFINETIDIYGDVLFNGKPVKNNKILMTLDNTSFNISTDNKGDYDHQIVLNEVGEHEIKVNVSYNNIISMNHKTIIVNNLSNDSDLIITIQTNKKVYSINETVLLHGTVYYNNSPINTTANLSLINKNISNILNVVNGSYSYNLSLNEIGNYTLKSEVIYNNLTAFNETNFSVIQNVSNNTLRIVDKKEEHIQVLPGQIFCINRTIDGPPGTNVTFVPLSSGGISIEKIEIKRKVENVSSQKELHKKVLPEVIDKNTNFYNDKKSTTKKLKEIEQIKQKLPQKLRELPEVSNSPVFQLGSQREVEICFRAPKLGEDKPRSGRISYLVYSDNTTYDYETTTWWNVGWNYCKNITVSSAISSYSYKIIFNSSNINYSHIKDDGSDIRIINAPCNSAGSEIPLWIETWDKSGDSIVWFKGDSSGSTTTYSVYYGNSLASDVSNGKNTFLIFDDFEGAALNTSYWTLTEDSGAQHPVNNSILLLDPSASGKRCYITKSYGGESMPLIKFKMKINTTYNTVTDFATPASLYWNNGGFFAYWDTSQHSIGDGGTNWHTFELIPNSSYTGRYDIYKDGIYKATPSTNYSSTTSIRFGESSTDTNYHGGASNFDWVIIRKYTSPEPTVTVGNTESQLPNSICGVYFNPVKYIIKDNEGNDIMWIDTSGNLYIRSLSINQNTAPPSLFPNQ